VQVQTSSISEQILCPFSKIIYHPNHLWLFVKHLAIRITTSKCIIRYQCTDWQQNVGTQQVFVKSFHRAKATTIMVVLLSGANPLQDGCKNSVLPLFCRVTIEGFQL
jgi:hypothetical protein